jgi:hypothetical protein
MAIPQSELNNLVGTIPTELGLLENLELLGLERGGLHGTIPTQLGALSNLYFLDMDFNELTGSLPSELFALSLLEQLDLNDNRLTGSIDGIGVFPKMAFMQLHGNAFTGTVPAAVGSYSDLGTFTLHRSQISGTMPNAVCQLVSNGVLDSLIADCLGSNSFIVCPCCTDCRLHA